MTYNEDDYEELEGDELEGEEPEDEFAHLDGAEAYKALAVHEPLRDVDFSEFRIPTLAQEEEENAQLSDLQAVQRKLFPKFATKRMNDILQPLQVSRIFPENYLDLNYFVVMNFVEEQGDDVDFLGAVTGTQVATSIGYEQRGRVDALEIAGVAHDEEFAKISKALDL